MSSNDETTQATFTDNGDIDVSEDIDDRHDDMDVDDFGEELGQYDTKGGFNKYEVTSALQKAVRRSDPELAAFCAWELVRSGHGWNYWQRAFTIAHEDLMLSDDPSVLNAVVNLFEMWKGRPPVGYWGNNQHESRARMCALKAAVLLARAESSRETEFMQDVFKAMRDERIEAHVEDRSVSSDLQFPEMPDVAADMHTYQGKQRGRGYDHFLVHSSRVDNVTDLAEKYKKINMREASYDFSRTEFDHALSPSDQGDYDEPGHRG